MTTPIYSVWYRDGTASLTQNGYEITGKNTYWLNANIKPGDLFTLDSSKFYEVASVDSNTKITLKTPFLSASVSNQNYAVIRNFTATLPSEIAAMATDILAKHERYIDEDMKTVQGKSAYEQAKDNGFVGTEAQWLDSLNAYGVAVKNGYVGDVNQWLQSLTAYGRAVDNGFNGTEAQWLESLLAGGEIAKIMKLIKPFDYNYPDRGTYLTDATLAGVKNSIVRCGWLGQYGYCRDVDVPLSESFWERVADGSYEDIWLGDIIRIGDPETNTIWDFNVAGFSTPWYGWKDAEKKEQSIIRRSLNPEIKNGVNLGYRPDTAIQSWGDAYKGGTGALTLISYWLQQVPGENVESFKMLDGTTWEPYGTCYGRTNTQGALYRLKETLANILGDHVRYVEHALVTAFDDEGNPSAWKKELSFCEVMSCSSIHGRFPNEVSGYDTVANTDCFGREALPLFRQLSTQVNSSPKTYAPCREQTRDKKWMGGTVERTHKPDVGVFQVVLTVK